VSNGQGGGRGEQKMQVSERSYPNAAGAKVFYTVEYRETATPKRKRHPDEGPPSQLMDRHKGVFFVGYVMVLFFGGFFFGVLGYLFW